MRRINCKRGESGSTLIPVLAAIIACTLIVSALIALSQLGTLGMAAHTRLQKSSYVCEGALNRIQWLVAAERANHPDTSLSTFDYSDSDYDRFLPDGVLHEIDYHGTPVQFTLTDAGAGLDFNQYRTNTFRMLQMNQSADSEYLENAADLAERITDYIDSDDTVTGDGMEAAEYEDNERYPLPRNAAILYREELFWIPGFTALFPPDKDGRLSSIRPFVPQSLRTVQTTTVNQATQQTRTSTTSIFTANPNIFGVNKDYLKNVCQLEDSEAEQVLEAIRLYQTERTPLADSLDSTILAGINNRFNWTVGRMITVRIDPGAAGSAPSRKLIATWTNPNDISGPENGLVRWIEWMFF